MADRAMQTLHRFGLDPIAECQADSNSYGFRTERCPADAIEQCHTVLSNRAGARFVLEGDIKACFDNISHDLLMKAVEKHTDSAWVRLYIRRWLTAPLQLPDGTEQARDRGTPQGGVISPLLSNLFLQYVFDKWLQQHYPHILWCRYADDGLLHCQSEAQARFLLNVVRERFEQCGLALHPAKTKIVYCKDARRTGDYPHTSFEFLGYRFQRRSCWAASLNRMILGFTPAVSRDALKSMRTVIRTSRLRSRTDLSLKEIADWLNPVMSGWLAYYGRYYRSAMYAIVRHVNKALVRWAMRKYKALRRGKTRAIAFLERCRKESPRLFVHWREGMKGAFV